MIVSLLIGSRSSKQPLMEFIDRVDVLAEQAGNDGGQLAAQASGVEDVTAQALQALLEEAADALEPADQITELHDLMWG